MPVPTIRPWTDTSHINTNTRAYIPSSRSIDWDIDRMSFWISLIVFDKKIFWNGSLWWERADFFDFHRSMRLSRCDEPMTFWIAITDFNCVILSIFCPLPMFSFAAQRWQASTNSNYVFMDWCAICTRRITWLAAISIDDFWFVSSYKTDALTLALLSLSRR